MYTRQFLQTILFLILEHERKLLFENTKNVILIRSYALLRPFKWYKFGHFCNLQYNTDSQNAVLILIELYYCYNIAFFAQMGHQLLC